MPTDIDCPNPGCAHIFPAADVVGVAAIVCPTCGGVFQVKAKRAVAHQTEDDPNVAIRADVDPQRGKSAPAAKKRPTLAWLVGGLIVLIGLTLTTAAVIRHRGPPPSSGPEPFRSIDHNYGVRLPGPSWQQDSDLALRLRGVLAFRRANPDAQVVLVVRDYPKYVPTDAELRDEAVIHLRGFPVENLQREDKSDGATFAGKPTGRFVFQGEIDNVTVSGDAQYLAYQGAAYILYRWCPAAEVESAESELADLANRFALLDLHPNWQPARQSFSGMKAAYSLTADGNRWDKAPYPPNDYDPAADLALIGRPHEGAVDAARQAQLLVLLLPAGKGDATERAKSHLLARQKEVYEETTMTETPPVDENTATDHVGSVSGKVLTLRVTNRKDRERFVVLGAVPRADGPLVIWAECDFACRAMWEADFRKLVASYQPPK